jgi:hypothetical protein
MSKCERFRLQVALQVLLRPATDIAADNQSSHDAPADVRDVYRDAVNAALARCTPLHFSDGRGGAVAGRPIAIRFVDNRTIDDGKAP